MPLPKPTPIGAERFGRLSLCRKKTGLSEQELSVVVSVMSAERAENAYPTRSAIFQISGTNDESMPSRMVRAGWLENAGKIGGGLVLYKASERAWAELLGRDVEAAE